MPGLQIISEHSDALDARVRVPGDKSISHRAVILSALADGESEISGLLEGEDVLATLAAFRAMGVRASGPEEGRLLIHGAGMSGLQPPAAELDMGNSGTAMRLLCGVMAAQQFPSRLVGDESLSTRPMRRIAGPLGQMGAVVQTGEGGTPPLGLSPAGGLRGIDYEMPVASAQVKSALLLAGLYADGTTCVTEPAVTRDHTERMLRAFGYPCEVQGSRICVTGGGTLHAANFDVPTDISSAAFFIVAAAITPGSRLLLEHVGVNPTRTGIIDVMQSMGADIRIVNPREICGEPVADIDVRHRSLRGIEIDPDVVPRAIDEFPAICIAAAAADGDTLVSGAGELRTKESDRIRAVVLGLRAIGIDVDEMEDGLRVRGGRFRAGTVDSHGDHRIAMAFSLAGPLSDGPVTIDRCENVATSFPGFVKTANQAGMNMHEVGP